MLYILCYLIYSIAVGAFIALGHGRSRGHRTELGLCAVVDAALLFHRSLPV